MFSYSLILIIGSSLFHGLVFTKAPLHAKMPTVISPTNLLLWEGSLDMDKVIGFIYCFANSDVKAYVCLKNVCQHVIRRIKTDETDAQNRVQSVSKRAPFIGLFLSGIATFKDHTMGNGWRPRRSSNNP